MSLQFRILLNYHFFFIIIIFILFQMLLKYDIICMKIGQGKGLIILLDVFIMFMGSECTAIIMIKVAKGQQQ